MSTAYFTDGSYAVWQGRPSGSSYRQFEDMCRYGHSPSLSCYLTLLPPTLPGLESDWKSQNTPSDMSLFFSNAYYVKNNFNGGMETFA